MNPADAGTIVELLVAFFLLWGNPQEALPGRTWEYVTAQGRTVRFLVEPSTRRDGDAAFRTLKVSVGGLGPEPELTAITFRREVNRLEIVPADEPMGAPRLLEVPTLSAGSCFMTPTGKSGQVLLAAAGREFSLGGRVLPSADLFLLELGRERFRLVSASGEGLVRLEQLALPDGLEPTEELLSRPVLPRRSWAQAADPARSCGWAAPSHPLLDLEFDDGGKPTLPWKGGLRGIDPAALGPEGRAAPDLEGRARIVLGGDGEDPLLHLETLRRLAVYLSTVGGKALALDDHALARMRDFTREFSLATLYGKVSKGPRPSFYFDLGILLEAFRECGAREEMDGLPFVQHAVHEEPDNAVFHLGLSLCYEARGLSERADEYRNWALTLAAPPAPIHDRLERTMRAARDARTWTREKAELAARVALARPAVPVIVVRKDGRRVEGELLEFGSRVYRVRVGQTVEEIAEQEVRKIEFRR